MREALVVLGAFVFLTLAFLTILIVPGLVSAPDTGLVALGLGILCTWAIAFALVMIRLFRMKV